jgi:hypothetical protein
MVDAYVDRKHGREPISYKHALLEPILKETFGGILYQEQVMRIANVLSGFSLNEADSLRKAMGKKKPEILAKFKQKFADGAEKNGVPRQTAEEIFEQIEYFAGYGFNKSHSAAYALVTYQTAWLKANHPKEYSGRSAHVRNGVHRQGRRIRGRNASDGHFRAPAGRQSFACELYGRKRRGSLRHGGHPRSRRPRRRRPLRRARFGRHVQGRLRSLRTRRPRRPQQGRHHGDDPRGGSRQSPGESRPKRCPPSTTRFPRAPRRRATGDRGQASLFGDPEPGEGAGGAAYAPIPEFDEQERLQFERRARFLSHRPPAEPPSEDAPTVQHVEREGPTENSKTAPKSPSADSCARCVRW